MTRIKEVGELKGWVLYDGSCPLCRAWARRVEPLLTRHSFDLAPLQQPWVEECLSISLEDRPEEMWVVTPQGWRWGGADALIFVASQIWWARPFAALAVIPGVRPLLRGAYRFLAGRRHCDTGCATSGRPYDRVAILALPAAWPLLDVPPWTTMWLIAACLFFGAKGLAWFDGAPPNFRRSWFFWMLFALTWPDMAAREFRARGPLVPAVEIRRWLAVLGKMICGAILIWGVARHGEHPLLAGWIGMWGLALLVHFGLFDLMALAWQRRGVRARPLMNAPAHSTSLSEFWGRRWNRAFHQLAYRFCFVPLRRTLGPATALMIVFLISGLIHDLIISVPAGGGYGWPTCYFLVQGFGVLVEKSPWGRRIGLGGGRRGRLFTLLVTVGPVWALFHPLFVERVMVPFLRAIGAL